MKKIFIPILLAIISGGILFSPLIFKLSDHLFPTEGSPMNMCFSDSCYESIDKNFMGTELLALILFVIFSLSLLLVISVFSIKFYRKISNQRRQKNKKS